jgi:hypothetical protein
MARIIILNESEAIFLRRWADDNRVNLHSAIRRWQANFGDRTAITVVEAEKLKEDRRLKDEKSDH